MTWYAAHIISHFEFQDHAKREIPVYEDIVLIEANSDDQARAKAEQYLTENYQTDRPTPSTQSDTWNGHPGIWVVDGIRKIIEAEAPYQRSEGIEISYSQYLCPDSDTVRALVNGESVSLIYEE
jgi:hypothetical protein